MTETINYNDFLEIFVKNQENNTIIYKNEIINIDYNLLINIFNNTNCISDKNINIIICNYIFIDLNSVSCSYCGCLCYKSMMCHDLIKCDKCCIRIFGFLSYPAYKIHEDKKEIIENLQLKCCTICKKSHSIINCCKKYCSLCNYNFDEIFNYKSNSIKEHYYNVCNVFISVTKERGIIKSCFFCKKIVWKYEYNQHKKKCSHKYFVKLFPKMIEYNLKSEKTMIVINNNHDYKINIKNLSYENISIRYNIFYQKIWWIIKKI